MLLFWIPTFHHLHHRLRHRAAWWWLLFIGPCTLTQNSWKTFTSPPFLTLPLILVAGFSVGLWFEFVGILRFIDNSLRRHRSAAPFALQASSTGMAFHIAAAFTALGNSRSPWRWLSSSTSPASRWPTRIRRIPGVNILPFLPARTPLPRHLLQPAGDDRIIACPHRQIYSSLCVKRAAAHRRIHAGEAMHPPGSSAHGPIDTRWTATGRTARPSLLATHISRRFLPHPAFGPPKLTQYTVPSRQIRRYESITVIPNHQPTTFSTSPRPFPRLCKVIGPSVSVMGALFFSEPRISSCAYGFEHDIKTGRKHGRSLDGLLRQPGWDPSLYRSYERMT